MKKHFEPPTIELQEKLISRLLSNPRFQMVDREELNNIFKEQKLQISGAIEHQTAVELGKILGVQAILVGSINNYGRTLMRMPYTKTTITFRLIEVESARVLCSKEVVANNVNMFYPFRNVSASLNQAVNAIAETINQSQP